MKGIGKQELRKRMQKKRSELSSKERKIQSLHVSKNLIKYIDRQAIKVIHLFIPIKDEIDITILIRYCLKTGIKTIVSKTLSNRELKHLLLSSLSDLVYGKFGTKYPQGEIEYLGSYDLILVPGLAFDIKGNRLGYGAAYYDKFLKNYPKTFKIAPIFDLQLMDFVPTEIHDEKINSLFLPEKQILIK